jgi:allantoinase
LTFSLAIKGGTLVSGEGSVRGDVYVSGSLIEHVGLEDFPADKVVDATGLQVLPGMVDTHVHLMDPGDTSREDFPTGSAAAAAAGVTTIIEHTHSSPVRTTAELADKRSYLSGRSNVDYGLAAHVWPDQIHGLEDLWAGGVSFFKIFTCTTHGVPGLDESNLSRALNVIASFGGNCLVHCEDETITASNEANLVARGRSDNGVVTEWRSREAEERAVATVSRLAAATGVKATIAHVSNPAIASIIANYRQGGADIVGESCPQYFGLREGDVLTEGSLRKFTPPARARTDADEDEMWALLRSSSLNHISTDHAPSSKEQKGGGIWAAPFGLPGLDTTLPYLLDSVDRAKLSIEDVVRAYSEAPARRYGLFPRKGILAAGSDADLVLVEPGREWLVSDDDIISKAGWSPFSGRTMTGSVRATLLRGQFIAEDRNPMDERTGLFISGPGG